MTPLKGLPFEETCTPAKMYVCHCEQCRYVKNKRKNRKVKAIINRMINKKRRTLSGVGGVHYWA